MMGGEWVLETEIMEVVVTGNNRIEGVPICNQYRFLRRLSLNSQFYRFRLEGDLLEQGISSPSSPFPDTFNSPLQILLIHCQAQPAPYPEVFVF